jgi:hypothetical protein
VTRDRRPHGLEAAGGGDAGDVAAGDRLGSCPSCGAELRTTLARDPTTGRVERAILHPIPFCSYFGETDPTTIECDIRKATTT